MIPRHAILSRFSTLCCFLGGEHTLFAPWAYGGHDLSWENGWQIGQTLPQPIHERRGKMDDRFWSQGHLPTGQSGDPWILQKGLYFGYFFFFSKCAHDSNLDFRDKAKTKCTKLKIFFEKQEFLEWELYSDQRREKKGLSRQRIGIKGWEREVSLYLPFLKYLLCNLNSIVA